MLAVGIHRFGGPEVVVPVEIEVDPLDDGQVAIAVQAAVVNPADVMLRRGQLRDVVHGEPPYVGGLELAGTVTAAAPGTAFAAGDRVAAITSFIPGGRGGHVACAVLDARRVARVPDGLSNEHAATVPMNGLTARLSLDRLGLERGQTLGVTGAAGAVGGYVTELARRDGLAVVGIAGEDDEAFVRGAGAEVFVPRGPDLARRLRAAVPAGVDGLVDAALLGPEVHALVADRGRVVVLRGTAGPAARGVTVLRVSVQEYAKHQDALACLLALAAAGELTTRVAATLPAAQADEAHRLLDRGGLRGRVLLTFA